MGDFQNFKFEDAIPDLSPETQLNFRKFLQVAGIENMLINDGRRISDAEVLNEIRKEVALLTKGGEGHMSSLIPACLNGDDETVKALLPSGDYDVNEVAPDGETALTCAVSANALRIVEMLLKHGADPNFRGKKVECTPLMEAASVGYTDIVRLLLEYGACVGQKSSTGNTALHYAATAGHLDCVRLLLQYNSPMEVQNETGHTPLMEATSNGHIDVARCLIKHGCDINTHSTEFKESALTLASYKGHTEMVRFLLEAGADHEHRTDEMHTALMEAAMEGHVEVAHLLLAHGANVNIPQDSFESPLTLAACGGHTELALLLIGYGADIEEVNDEGYTPLMEAAREGHEETVALLLAAGADVNARTEETQETALTLAACGGFIEVCEMLLNAGADIEVGGVGCSTPLMEAAQEGHLDLVRRLLQRGAAVNAVTATGDTALHYAAENGHVKVCKELLDWGAVFGAMTEGGRTPLMKAARSGNLEVVQLFLEHGAPIDQPTSQNDANALSLACSGGHAKVVKYLLQHGADPQYQLRDGSTMLIEAARSGNPAVLRLILDYPRCLTQTSAPQPLGNQIPQQQQIQLLQQQQPYQTLINGVSSSTANAPLLPMSGEACLDPSHAHLRAHQHSVACRAHHTHQSLAFQGPVPGLVPAVNSNQSSHLDAALVSAYAVGWADGAASLVQQQNQSLPINDSLTSASAPGLCSSSVTSQQTSALFDPTSLSQSLSFKALSANISAHQLRTAINGPIFAESRTQLVDPSATSDNFMTPAVNQSCGSGVGGASCHSSMTTDSVSSLSGSSSVSNGSSASSLATGVPVDTNEDMGAGLLQALFQELMPDKDELFRRFEAVMCPYNTLRVSRNATGQPATGNTSSTAVTITTNAAAIALSRLVDQQQLQQQCHQRSVVLQTDTDIVPVPQSLLPCSHAPSADLLTKMTRAMQREAQTVERIPSSTQPSYNLRALDHEELMESCILGSTTSSTTPILSSCHSSSSVASTQECSISSSSGVADSTCFPGSLVAATLAPTSPMNAYDYEVERASELLPSVINSPFFSGVLEPGLANAQNIFQESAVDHDLLTTYRHYHHPGSHFTCTLDAAPTAAAMSSLDHSNIHSSLHHHRHHHLAVSGGGDGLAGPGGLLHHQTSGLSVDALMNNPATALAYDPTSVLAAHALHQSTIPVSSGSRILPTCPPTSVFTSSGTPLPPPHVLPHPNDLTSLNVLPNASSVGDSVTPVNAPSLIDINACIESSMETALTLACHGGYTELVRLLLERGADREHRDKKSYTPLHTAVHANQRAVIALLLDYGADIEAQVDRTKDTALSIACSQGTLEIVEELLNRGANKEHRNISDYTPLSLAASGGHVEVIQLLLRHGAEINSRTGSKLGISPLMLASMNGHTNAVRLLLEHGSDINAHIETNRNTALTLACFQGRHAVVSLLVERKANIEHRAKTGLTPLMEAASGDYVEVGMILLDHGADVNAAPVPSSRDTALTIAADKGNAKFVNLLLERGAIVEARNKKGATPLWLASNGGHLEVVQSLIRYGADVNSQDNRKVSCLMAAFRKGHVNVVRLLVQHVTQFPSDKDCIRHIKMAVTDKELAKRCQQCREIIIAAKEKQEGEARKNANCLLEQIEQEEEERANREAMQARKRERKRMKRKAKQEKERQVKDEGQVSSQLALEEHDPDPDQDCLDTSSPERRVSMLSQAVQQVRKNSYGNQQFSEDMTETPEVARIGTAGTKSNSPEKSTVNNRNELSGTMVFSEASAQFELSANSAVQPTFSKPSSFQSASPPKQLRPEFSANHTSPDPGSLSPEQTATSTTEAKREKHRNKKQSQRAAKRAATVESIPSSNADTFLDSSVPEDSSSVLSVLPVTTAYYSPSSNGDGEVNWNALIESQTAHLGQYLASGMNVSSGTESNTWTVVLPSSTTRTQRGAANSRVGVESADWKTSSTSGPSKRRISIPVSRHDIGKVIGQGGAVVSALRNMSGIQIDIESARSDEVTERMVYLKGSSDAVQRTYETIQGLLNGSIAGNDVLLMYAALKKSTTTANPAFGKSILTALSSKASSGVTVTTHSSAAKASGTSRNSIQKSNRRSGKSSATAANTSSVTASARSLSSQPPVSSLLNRSSNVPSKASPIVATCANNNNNSAGLCSSTTLSSATHGTSIMSTKLATSIPSGWSTRVTPVNSSAKGNFASVAAAGLVPQSSRASGKSISEQPKIQSAVRHSHVPGLMDSFPSMPLTTAPVSLLSLNVTPSSTTSQMFPDLALSFSTGLDVALDSLDENSFPPLSSTTSRGPVSSASEEKDEAFMFASEVLSTGSKEISATLSRENPPCEGESVRFESDVCSLAPGNPVVDSELGSLPLSSAVFKPLTVSPPVVTGLQASQPSTPVGSGSNQTTACANTPPATTTQVRQFARAPGSERSAQQRSGNVNSTPSVVPLGDTYPPSLMSLEVNGSSGIDDAILLTPTKRAVSPEIHDAEFHHPSLPARFRSDQVGDWHEPDSVAPAVSQSSLSFSKLSGFQMDSHVPMELASTGTTSLQQPVLSPHAAQSIGLSKAQLRASDSIHVSSISSPWPLQGSDLNPNAAAFEPSAFQPTGSATQLPTIGSIHVTMTDSSPLLSPSVVHSDYSDLTHSNPLCTGYGLDSVVSTGLRQASLKPTVSGVPISLQQSSGDVSAFTGSSVGLLPPTFSQNSSVSTVARSKPMLSVPPSTFTDSRAALLNGFTASSQPHPTSSLSTFVPGTQFHPLFPSNAQHNLLASGNIQGSPSQPQSSLGSSRLTGGSPHPLLNQAQLAMGCPSVSVGSYTPPPCMSGFLQPGVPTPAVNAAVGTHPCGSFSTHLFNGTGTAVPMLNSGSLIGTNTSMHQSSTVQPIGAERRRQIATSVTLPSGPYPPSTSNGTGPAAYGFSSPAIQNQPSTAHLQTSQQSSNQNLFMLMNLMQQQQQLALGTTNSSHPPSSWQAAASVWPSGSYSSGNSLAPPVKVPSGGLTDLGSYNGTNLLPGTVPSNSVSTNNQQQQLVAAMAAMSMCPWNSGQSAGSSMMNPAPGGQSRWIYPSQTGSGYPTANPAQTPFFPDQLSQSLKPTVGAPHPTATHYPQAVHRPHE